MLFSLIISLHNILIYEAWLYWWEGTGRSLALRVSLPLLQRTWSLSLGQIADFFSCSVILKKFPLLPQPPSSPPAVSQSFCQESSDASNPCAVSIPSHPTMFPIDPRMGVLPMAVVQSSSSWACACPFVAVGKKSFQIQTKCFWKDWKVTEAHFLGFFSILLFSNFTTCGVNFYEKKASMF